jgi:hypothetical protein
VTDSLFRQTTALATKAVSQKKNPSTSVRHLKVTKFMAQTYGSEHITRANIWVSLVGYSNSWTIIEDLLHEWLSASFE